MLQIQQASPMETRPDSKPAGSFASPERRSSNMLLVKSLRALRSTSQEKKGRFPRR